ncbi:MAG TPA: pyridoxamine 5'-phosphate oxidase family protein [Fimbriimonadaceae bacterium]|nr:pyridoxamine 5'-phosphate oxidase family protein [Fimbriimonadaceae bacterium]
MIQALDRSEIEELLRSSTFARIGCHADGETYVVPVAYVYDVPHRRLVLQSKHGKKIEMMRSNPDVCVEVDDPGDLLTWRSAILWGRFEELHGTAALEALAMLVDRFEPLFEAARADSLTPPRLRHEPERDVVFAIQIDRITGRWEDGAH